MCPCDFQHQASKLACSASDMHASTPGHVGQRHHAIRDVHRLRGDVHMGEEVLPHEAVV